MKDDLDTLKITLIKITYPEEHCNVTSHNP